MNRLLGNRAEQLTSIVAAWAIVLAPLAALSNCCCAARAAAAQAAAPEQAAGDRLEPVSCCATAPADACASQPLPACCTPAASGQALDNTSLQSCACQTACCDTNISQAAAVVAPASQQVVAHDWAALPVALLDELPWVTRSSWSADAHEPVFLSAHARCAMLCRWLN